MSAKCFTGKNPFISSKYNFRQTGRKVMSGNCAFIIALLLLSLVQGNAALGASTPDNDYCAEVPAGPCGPGGQCRVVPNPANRWAYWCSTAGDGNWDNPDNWDPIAPPGLPLPPDCDTYVAIQPFLLGPTVFNNATCSRLAVHPWSWSGAPNTELNIAPGAGSFDCGSMIGINSIRNDPGTREGRGILNIYGGTIFTSTDMHAYGYGTRTACLWVGGSENTTSPCPGYLNMMGGLMVVPSIAIYDGVINLYGGTLRGTSSNSDDFVISGMYPMNQINVAGGKLLLKGDRMAELFNYMATGRIVPYQNRARSYLVIDYNISTPGYTTVTAVPDFGSAWNPNPAVGQEEVAFNPPPFLNWSPGDWVQDPNGHQVYFGTSWTEVNDANTSTPVIYRGSTDQTTFDTNSRVGPLIPATTYYWRVDELNINNPDSPWIGQVWNFTTLSGQARLPIPANDSNDPFDINMPSLKWTKGQWTATTNGHRVYFGTSWDDVNDATTASTTSPAIYRGQQDPCSYLLSKLKSPTLDYNLVPDATYYWRVDEVNNSHPSSPWKGRIWHFRFSREYAVDDFEVNSMPRWMRSYLSNPTASCPGGGYTNTGATLQWDQVVGKTLKFNYDNTGSTGRDFYSEARYEYNSTGCDWTASAVPSGAPKILYISYKGQPTNSADPIYDRMYMFIQDTAGNRTGSTPYPVPIQNSDPTAQQVNQWTAWRILLSDLNAPNVNLQRIRYFVLGFGQRCLRWNPDPEAPRGGTGTVNFDNLRLSQPICNEQYTSIYDFAPDCVVDLTDFDVFARDWLLTGTTLTYDDAVAPTAIPVLWYDFNETSGQIVANSGWAGSDYNGTVENNVPSTWGSPGVIGGCINLPYVTPGLPGTYIDVPPEILAPFASIDGPYAITFTFWINQDPNVVLDATRPRLISAGDSSDSTGKEDIMIIAPTGRHPIESTGPQVMFKMKNQMDSPQMRHGDFAGRWNHYAFVKDTDAGYMRIYHNGQEIASRTLSTTGRPVLESTPIRFRIAKRWPDGTWGPWPGRLDDFRMYDVALTANEIAYIATKGTGSITVDLVETTNLNHDAIVNFGDFALFANEWMTEKLWP
jgi:hypothetical protein